MSNTKHTPGPWASIQANADLDVYYRPLCVVIGDKRLRVADDPDDIDHANARLIAAAPEAAAERDRLKAENGLLLEALTDILEWCENAQRNTGIEPYGLKVARAAIAKARS